MTTDMTISQLTHRLLPILVAMTAVIAPALAAAPPRQAPRWEPVEVVLAELADDAFDVTVRDNYVYVYSPTAVNIKIFTILGQLISQGIIPAGTSRLRIAARGIYILKAGSITRRITI